MHAKANVSQGLSLTNVAPQTALISRLKVMCSGDLFLHYIEPCQFVDSVEYELARLTSSEEEEPCFQVCTCIHIHVVIQLVCITLHIQRISLKNI